MVVSDDTAHVPNPSTRKKIPQLFQTLIPQLFLSHVKKIRKCDVIGFSTYMGIVGDEIDCCVCRLHAT